MKGTLFVDLLDFLETRFGPELVEEVIAGASGQLSTGGAYTRVGNYPHAEMLTLVSVVSELSGAHAGTIVSEFSHYLMGVFSRTHPEFFGACDDVFDFLHSIDQRIHVEVRKLYPDASPPHVLATGQDDGSLLIEYTSHRPMAAIAHALIEAAGSAYGQALQVESLQAEDDTHRLMRVRKLSHG